MGYPVSVNHEVDPVCRIEGHLGVAVVTSGGVITNAFAHGNLWRGFENFLLGREINDAITFVQRICGVCPVPHGHTATQAVDSVLGYNQGHISFAWDAHGGGSNDGYGVPAKAVSIRNLVQAADSIMSAITHFYHLAAPSYIQGPAIPPWTPYFNDNYYAEISHPTASMRSHGRVAPVMGSDGFSDGLWSTVIRSYVVAIRVRRLMFEAGALFAGRMPMTSTFCGGGVTFDGQEDLTDRANLFRDLMKEVALFVIQEYVPIVLALGVLYPDYDNTHNGGAGYGSGLGRFLAWGMFPESDVYTDAAKLLYPGGYVDLNGGGGDFQVLTKGDVKSEFLSGPRSVPNNLTEDIASSRYAIDATHDSAAYGANTYAYPGDVSRTKPSRSKAGAYTYMKAPRWNGKSCEVGPMARMFVAGFMSDGGTYAGGFGSYYTAYVKTAGGNTGLHPGMVAADIAVALLKAGLATVRNSVLGAAMHAGGTFNGHTYAAIPAVTATTDFAYADIVTNLAEIQDILGTTGAHATIVAAYTHANTVITGAITDWILAVKSGISTMDRLRARGLECLFLCQQVVGIYNPNTASFDETNSWITKLKQQTGNSSLDTEYSTWRNKSIPTGTHKGWGASEAARGALMHQTTITDGKITKYQCIVPTTWNGSPVIGSSGVKLNHGAIEAACIDAPFDNLGATFDSAGGAIGNNSGTAAGGVEVLRIAQSFDPCIACAIH